MATTKKYTLNVNGQQSREFSRKVDAINAGEKSGEAFQVLSPSNAVVHESGQVEPEPTPTPEPTKAKATKATPAKGGNTVAYTKEHGANRFFPAMAAGAVALAETMGLTVEPDNATRTLSVQANKTETRKFEKAVTAMWREAWAAFKEWKRENRDHRAEQWKTNDGKRAMYAEESAFLEGYARDYTSVV